VRRTGPESDRESASPPRRATRREPEPSGQETETGGDPVASLHRAVGNRAVQSAFEDTSAPGLTAERRPAEPESRVDSDAGATASSTDELRPGTGRPLPPGLREEAERRFGESFRDVRLHTGRAAGKQAESVSADAFTFGRNVVFAPGEYAASTERGRRLLAHELAHVAQQSGGSARSLARRQMEAAADRAAAEFSGTDGPVDVAEQGGTFLARQPTRSSPAVGQMSDEELRRAVALLRRRLRTGDDPQLRSNLEALVAELRRREREQFERDLEEFEESEPGVLSALLPARTRPYYRDPSESIESPTLRALTSGSKERTFGALVAGQSAAQTAATAGLVGAAVAGSIAVTVAGWPLVTSAAAMTVEAATQAGGYVLSLAVTNPIKTQAIAEFAVGMTMDVALSGGIEEFFQDLQTAGGAASMAAEVVVTLVIPIKQAGPGARKRVRVKTRVTSVDDSGNATVKVREAPSVETGRGGESTTRAAKETGTETPEGRPRSEGGPAEAGEGVEPGRKRATEKRTRQERKRELARDPDRGNAIDETSRREAEVALSLEERGDLPAPVRRPGAEESGDFVDGAGHEWDVKTPRSREVLEAKIPESRHEAGEPIGGEFDLASTVRDIETEFEVEGERVVLNTSFLTPADTEQLEEAVRREGLESIVLFYP